jgi:hypothetical protein
VVEKEEQRINSKVRAKALDVMLGLFKELEAFQTESLEIEALDYKVFNSYIMPFIRRLIEASKGDIVVRHAIATNLSRMMKVGSIFIELAITSCNKRRLD